VRETGNHDSLLETDGMYAKLYHMQFEKHRVGV
jgi:ABC-type multidrug transport system fused ATPase/permease subunit